MYSELSEPWQRCLTLACESLFRGGLPIGSAVYDNAGRLLATGRNRYYEKGGTIKNHAELEALGAIDLPDLEQYLTLYSTVEPCPMCFGAINVARVSELHFGTRDTWSGSTGLAGANFYMARKVIKIVHHPELERVCSILLHYGMYRHGLKLDHEIFTRTEAIVPDIRHVIEDMATSVKMDNTLYANAERLIDTIAEEWCGKNTDNPNPA